MNEVRRPLDVAEQMKRLIPEDIAVSISLHAGIDWLINDFSFKAPEQAHYCWGRLEEFVNNEILEGGDPDITQDWQVKIVSLLTGKTEEEVQNITTLATKNIKLLIELGFERENVKSNYSWLFKIPGRGHMYSNNEFEKLRVIIERDGGMTLKLNGIYHKGCDPKAVIHQLVKVAMDWKEKETYEAVDERMKDVIRGRN